jgi:hypothetical protein
MSIVDRTPQGRFAPGQSGNPVGRKLGSRNKSTLAIDAAFEARAEDLATRLVSLASGGNGAAMRICFDRMVPRRKGHLVAFPLPTVETHADAVDAAAGVLAGISEGELTAEEAQEVIKALEAFVRLRNAPAKPGAAP